VASDCRPVEPANSPKILDSSIEPLLLGDAVELQSNNVWRGTKGILTNWCPIKKAFWFESLDLSRKAISGWMKEQWDDEETGICRLVKIDHPNDSPKPDSSSEPMRDAFEAEMVKRYGEGRASFARNENRYFDSSMEIAWQAFQAGAKYQSHQIDKPEQVKQFVIVTDNDENQTLYVDGVLRNGDNTVYGCDVADAANGCAIKIELRDADFIVEHWPLSLKDLIAEAKQHEPSPLAPSPCMDGINVDQFIEGVTEARERASDPINPSHYKQGGIECIEAIKAATGDGFIGYVWGNVLKYLWRWPKKGGVDDLKKARWYLDRLIQEVGE
jgi:hypothetical protein